MNAQADILRLITDSDPMRAHAHRVYADSLPEVASTAYKPPQLCYPGEDRDILARHALRFALHVLCVAGQRASVDSLGQHNDFAAQVADLAQALLDGEDYAARFARSCNEDDFAMVDAAGGLIRDAAENIARGWGV